MQVTKYVSKMSPASMDFAVAVVDILDELSDMIDDYEEGRQAERDMMHFLYGDGQ